MKLFFAILALGVAALPAQAGEPGHKGRNGAYTVAFSDIARNGDRSWKGAKVTFHGPNGYVQSFTATFEGSHNGEIDFKGDSCRVHIDTVTDPQGSDAGWLVGFESYDADEMGCDMLDEVLPFELAGTFTYF